MSAPSPKPDDIASRASGPRRDDESILEEARGLLNKMSTDANQTSGLAEALSKIIDHLEAQNTALKLENSKLQLQLLLAEVEHGNMQDLLREREAQLEEE